MKLTRRNLRGLLALKIAVASISMVASHAAHADTLSCEESVSGIRNSVIAEMTAEAPAGSGSALDALIADAGNDGDLMAGLAGEDGGMWETNINFGDSTDTSELAAGMEARYSSSLFLQIDQELRRSREEEIADLRKKLAGFNVADLSTIAKIGKDTLRNSQAHSFNSGTLNEAREADLANAKAIKRAFAEISIVLENDIDTSNREAMQEAIDAQLNPTRVQAARNGLTSFIQGGQDALSNIMDSASKIRVTIPGTGMFRRTQEVELTDDEAEAMYNDPNTSEEVKEEIFNKLKVKRGSLLDFVKNITVKIGEMIDKVDEAADRSKEEYRRSIILEHQLNDDVNAIRFAIHQVNEAKTKVDAALAAQPQGEQDPRLLEVAGQYGQALELLNRRLQSRRLHIQQERLRREGMKQDYEMYVSLSMAAQEDLEAIEFQVAASTARALGGSIARELAETSDHMSGLAHRMTEDVAQFNHETNMRVRTMVFDRSDAIERVEEQIASHQRRLTELAQNDDVIAERMSTFDARQAGVDEAIHQIAQVGVTADVSDFNFSAEENAAGVGPEEDAMFADVEEGLEAVEADTSERSGSL